jgi:hypothetical protein
MPRTEAESVLVKSRMMEVDDRFHEGEGEGEGEGEEHQEGVFLLDPAGEYGSCEYV